MHRKLFLLMALITIAITIVGCATASPNAMSGIPFVIYDDFVLNDNHYRLYKIEKADFIGSENTNDSGNLYYQYQEFERMDSDEWRLNVEYDNKILTTSADLNEEVLNTINQRLLDSLKSYEESLDFKFEYNDYNSQRIEEFIVDQTIDYTSVLIVDIYIPYQLTINQNEDIFIFVPVKKILGYRNDDLISLVCDNQKINLSHYSFVSNENVQKKSDIFK